MSPVNRGIWYNVIIISISIILFSCDTTTVSISVEKIRGGKIEIDNRPLDFYIIRKYGHNQGDSLFHLKLEKGNHRLKILTNQLNSIDTTFNVRSGETYIGINLETGEINL